MMVMIATLICISMCFVVEDTMAASNKIGRHVIALVIERNCFVETFSWSGLFFSLSTNRRSERKQRELVR